MRLLEGDDVGALDRLRRARGAGAPGFYTAARSQAAIRELLIGFRAKPLDDEAREDLGLKDVRGLLVMAVRESGAASRAGLAPGDAVLTIAGSPAKNPTPSSTDIFRMSSMVFPRTVTSSVSLLNRAPLHAPQVTSTSGMK